MYVARFSHSLEYLLSCRLPGIRTRSVVTTTLKLIVDFAMVWLLSARPFLPREISLVGRIRILIVAEVITRSRFIQGGSFVELCLMGFKLPTYLPTY